MMKSIFLATVASLIMSGAAIAADAVDQIPTAPAAVDTPATFSWAGGYAGALTGYGWTKGEFSSDDESTKATLKGGRVGGFAGWNFDVGNNVILGAEGDINYDFNEKTIGSTKVKTDLSGSVRARAGYAVDKALFFVAGGWTAARAEANDVGYNPKDTFNGWTVGGGVDYAITNKIFARGEYRYNDFGSKNMDGTKFDLKQHVINVGVGVKF
jgi:outer membrane immunogenic protein